MADFNVEGITLEISDPAQLTRDEWHEAQTFDALAGSTIGRSEAEISHYLHLGDDEFDTYVATHADSNEAVRLGLLNPGQIYENALIVRVRHGNDLVGILRGADNISGTSPEIIAAKRRSIIKDYATIQEAAVHPDLRGHGLTPIAAYRFLETRQALQPVPVYTFGELPMVLEDLIYKCQALPVPYRLRLPKTWIVFTAT